jgi:hypothetical protein
MEKYIMDNKELIEKWIVWLNAEIKFGIATDLEKKHKRELKEFLEGLL